MSIIKHITFKNEQFVSATALFGETKVLRDIDKYTGQYTGDQYKFTNGTIPSA
jgi:hypothetical protein